MVLHAIEVGGLVLFVVIGVAALLNGGGDAGRDLDFPDGETPALPSIAGASLSFYALIGFEDAVNVAEETKDADAHLPAAAVPGAWHRRRRSTCW